MGAPERDAAVSRVDRNPLATLVITPAGPGLPTVQGIVLARVGDDCRLEVTEKTFELRRRRTVDLSSKEVERHSAALRQAKAPAFPVSPEVCDGSHYELTIAGEHWELRLSWWTIAPDGAEQLADFADWMAERAGTCDTVPSLA